MAYSILSSGKPYADYGMDAKAREAQRKGKEKAQARQKAFSDDVQFLSSKLQDLIDTYSQSQSMADREMASIYASYLKDLGEGGNKAYSIVNKYKKGYLPGLGRPRAIEAPAWS